MTSTLNDDTDNRNDSTDEEVEIEEKIVYIEFDTNRDFGKETDIKFHGLDREKPWINVNGINYFGEWEDGLETLLFLDETSDVKHDPLFETPLKKSYKIQHVTNKLLKMSRCVIAKKDEEETDLRQVVKMRNVKNEGDADDESSEEENIEEFYAAEADKKDKHELFNAKISSTSGLIELTNYSNEVVQSLTEEENELIEPKIEQIDDVGEDENNEVEISFAQEMVSYNLTDECILEAATQTLSNISDQALLDESEVKTSVLDDSQETLAQMSDLSVLDQSQNTLSDVNELPDDNTMSYAELKSVDFNLLNDVTPKDDTGGH